MEKEVSQGKRYIIKFRAWDRENATMYQWNCLEDYPLKGKNATFPQEFTGFCDKNSNEIYVGDIVNFRGYNTIVRFFDGAYVLWIIEPKSTMSFFDMRIMKDVTTEMEIVGNTFTYSEYLTHHLFS